MRKLIYIPMLHSEEAIERQGHTDEVVKDKIYSEIGDPFDKFWGLVQRSIEKRDWRNVRFYLEGTTQRLDVPEALFDFFPGYAPEHALMQYILADGGILEHTEDLELFLRRTALLQKISELQGQEGEVSELEDLMDEFETVVEEGDEVIARRIDETLQEGETGVLAIGAMHDVVTKLPSDIYVELIDKEIGEILKEIDPSLEVKINPEISRS